jgi:hypothetical protein
MPAIASSIAVALTASDKGGDRMALDEITRGQDLAAMWRSSAGPDNPAGPLYTGGQYAQADLTQRTGTGTGHCGTACSYSYTRYCC